MILLDLMMPHINGFEVNLRINNLLETRYLYQRLENQNQILEEKVKERTFDLEKANHELDHANKELKALDQAKDEHIDQNTGLNLALIKLIMDAHNGQIEVRNNQPMGATVKLTFNSNSIYLSKKTCQVSSL